MGLELREFKQLRVFLRESRFGEFREFRGSEVSYVPRNIPLTGYLIPPVPAKDQGDTLHPHRFRVVFWAWKFDVYTSCGGPLFGVGLLASIS